jgi:class 3 adenylate cyclase
MERALCPVLVGRERELDLLEDALIASNRGRGQVVVIAGEAGVGKTRLVNALRVSAARAGTAVMSGSCSEADLTLPYMPFVEGIGNYLASPDGERIKARLGPATRRQLGHLFPQLEQSSPVEIGDPGQARMRLYEALLTLLQIAAEQRGLLLILEDLHWADASTRELLDYLARRVRRSRILILGTYRSDELHRRHPLQPLVQAWQRAGTMETVQLPPLDQAGVARMASAIFDGAPVEEELRDFLFARTEGNPFVLEEFLKAALDQGDIFKTMQGWDRKAIGHLKLPATVKETILLRVERLQEQQANILRAAAVLGRCFDYRMLVGISGESETTVRAALRTFVEQQLAQEEPDAGYSFRHALTREAILDDMIAPERERLHARAADQLGEQPGANAMELASHLMAAARWQEAIPVALRAATDAEGRKGYLEAVHLYERLLDHTSDRCLRGELLSRLGKVQFFAGETRQAQRYLAEGIAILDQCGEARAVAGYRIWLGRCHWLRSRPDLARQEFEAARAALEPHGPSEDLAYAYVRLASLHTFDKEHEIALQLSREAVRIATEVGADAPRIHAYNYLGVNLQAMGQVDEGLRWLDRSYREAVAAGYDWIAVVALQNAIGDQLHYARGREALERLGWLQDMSGPLRSRDSGLLEAEGFLAVRARGEPERARRLLEPAVARAEEVEDTLFAHRMRLDLAHALAALDQLDEAWRVFPAKPATAETQEVMGFIYESMWLHLVGGNVAAAQVLAQQVVRMVEADPVRNTEIYLLDRAVDALLHADDVPTARRLLAIAHTDVFGRHPLLLRARGRLALAEGDLGSARENLREAVSALDGAEFADEEWPTRRAFAAALIASGDREGAERELRIVLLAARERGHLLEARLAARGLAELGVAVPDLVPSPPAAAPAVEVDGEGRQPTERLVTVMSIDIRGFTAITIQEPPHELADRVATFYRWAEQEIHRHQGLVDRYAGDAVLAIFNVTGGKLDHCIQAVEAALAIRDKAGFIGLPVGVGVAVGPAVVGQLSEGSPLTAVGETINLAARLQSQAQPGEVILSEEAYRRARHWLEEQRVSPIQDSLTLKGFPRPHVAYRLAVPIADGV